MAVTEDEHHPRDLGLQRLARVVGTAVAAVRPDETGLRPIPACRKALQRAGLDVNDMQIVELNEAFASQAIACLEDLSIHWRDEARVNPNGGAIGLGHPHGRLWRVASAPLGRRSWADRTSATPWSLCVSVWARACPRSSSDGRRDCR